MCKTRYLSAKTLQPARKEGIKCEVCYRSNLKAWMGPSSPLTGDPSLLPWRVFLAGPSRCAWALATKKVKRLANTKEAEDTEERSYFKLHNKV